MENDFNNRESTETRAFQSPETATLIRWQFDASEELEILYHKLKAEQLTQVTNEDGEVTWEWKPNPQSEPFMNEKGASRIIDMMSLQSSKMVTMSTFDDEEILMISREFMYSFISHVAKNYQDYGIKPKNLGIIARIVDNWVLSALHRAKDSESLTFLSQSQKHVETYSQNNQDKGSKLFGGFKF